jgi:hypothetical protein
MEANTQVSMGPDCVTTGASTYPCGSVGTQPFSRTTIKASVVILVRLGSLARGREAMDLVKCINAHGCTLPPFRAYQPVRSPGTPPASSVERA